MSRNLKLLISLIAIATVAAYVLLVTIPAQMAERSYRGAKALGEDLRKAFGFTPEVRVNNTIVLNQERAVLELAVVQQDFEHRYVWENSWLGSTKKIFITGTFKAKAGFDLHKKFSVNVRDGKAFVNLPSPKTLSVESVGDISYRDEQGIWNWVNIDDRTRATNAFIRDARRFADQATFPEKAKSEIEKKLTTLLKPYADDVIVTFEPPAQFPGIR